MSDPTSCRVYHGRGDVYTLKPYPEDRPRAYVRPAPTIADRVAISEIMTREVVCARHDLRIDALVPVMVRNHIGCIPVVDERGRPVGMITKLDLVEQLDRIDGGDRLIPETAGDVMMPLAMTLDERATVAHAAAMMALEDVHHIPVVTGGGAVCGIVSTLDVVRWLARNDGFVARGSLNDLGDIAASDWTEPTD
jgi:CBS domain-containing protein